MYALPYCLRFLVVRSEVGKSLQVWQAWLKRVYSIMICTFIYNKYIYMCKHKFSFTNISLLCIYISYQWLYTTSLELSIKRKSPNLKGCTSPPGFPSPRHCTAIQLSFTQGHKIFGSLKGRPWESNPWQIPMGRTIFFTYMNGCVVFFEWWVSR